MNRTPVVRRRMAGNDAYTFLMKELEKVDDVILEPLTSTEWPRDMPVITGGGLIESVASIDVTYASTGGDDDNLFFDMANDIPVIQADMSKSVARTFNFAEYMAFPTLEELIQCHKALTLLKSKGLANQVVQARQKKGSMAGLSSLNKSFSWSYSLTISYSQTVVNG